MKQIHKTESPSWLDQWKEQYVDANHREPGYADLDHHTRRKLRGTLIDEQGRICCYCMRRITLDSSHIEHFKPREKPEFKELQLDYRNLYASCEGQKDEDILSLQYCDQKKNNWFDPQMPELTDAGIERCISYHINGTVTPYHRSNDSRYLVETAIIENLGLNAPYLVRNRRKAINQSELVEELDYTDTDWADLLSYFDQMHQGRYEEYCGMFTNIISRECL